MENFNSKKRHYCWRCRRKAERMTMREFAEAIEIPVDIYIQAEKGIYTPVIYSKITNGIMEHNHTFGEKSEVYYRIRIRQDFFELKYVETEEEFAIINRHRDIHIKRLERVANKRYKRSF